VSAPEAAPPADGGPWVIDADGHVVEPPRAWDRYLPTRYRDYAPRVVQTDDAFWFVCHDRVGFRIPGRGESVGAPGQTPHRVDAPVAARGGSEPGPRIDDMGVDGIAAAALYPTFGLMIQGVTDREPALALCRAVNDWMAEYCSHDPTRLLGVGTLPMTDARDALGEARRCVEQLGFRGVWRRPEHFGRLPRLQDDAYEPLWGYLEEADIAFAIHPGMSGLVPYDELQRRYDDYFTALHATHFVVEHVLALTTFIAFGILERHPKLRVAFLESGAAWALSYLHRLDEHGELFGFDRGSLARAPTEYFARQCFVSVEEPEPGLAAMLDRCPDSVVFASDYPHADATFPGSTRSLLESHLLDGGAVRRVLRDNARRLYGLDRSAA
jgi:predicted TIM-barrel fold metal-dependent hydrolase